MKEGSIKDPPEKTTADKSPKILEPSILIPLKENWSNDIKEDKQLLSSSSEDKDPNHYYLEPVGPLRQRSQSKNVASSLRAEDRPQPTRQVVSDSEIDVIDELSNLTETTTKLDRGIIVAGFGCLKLLGQKNRVMRRLAFNPPSPIGYSFQPIKPHASKPSNENNQLDNVPSMTQQVTLSCFRDPEVRHVLPVEATLQNPFKIRGILINSKKNLISCLVLSWVTRKSLWTHLWSSSPKNLDKKNTKEQNEVPGKTADKLNSSVKRQDNTSTVISECKVRPSTSPEGSSCQTRQVKNLELLSGPPSEFIIEDMKRPFVIFSHGNSTDIGHSCAHLIRFAKTLKVNLLAYDYPGYGLSTGRPSETSMDTSLKTVYEYVTKSLGVPPHRIIIYGQSIGSAPSCSVASSSSKYPIGALVLHSPIASGMRLMLAKPQRTRFVDVFQNAERISDVPWPILILHGKEDAEVPFWHSALLVRNARRYSLASQLCKDKFTEHLKVSRTALEKSQSQEQTGSKTKTNRDIPILPRLSGRQRASSLPSTQASKKIKLSSRLSGGASKLCAVGPCRQGSKTETTETVDEKHFRKRVWFWAADDCGHNDIDVVKDVDYFEVLERFIRQNLLFVEDNNL